MYRYQRKLFEQEAIYIAGPECFYTYGYDMLAAMRVRAESLGFKVTLPNNHQLDLTNPDKQKRADSIFKDLETVMNETTVIIADLEAYRGAEPDSGTVYELGMAYAKGARCYGYSRDKRSVVTKNQGCVLTSGQVLDERGSSIPYGDIPFSPTIIGSTKIIEGDYDDCLKLLMVDLEEEYKQHGIKKSCGMKCDKPEVLPLKSGEERRQPKIYLSVFERYDENGAEILSQMKAICKHYGFEAVSPLDLADGAVFEEAENAYERAGQLFYNYQKHVRDADVIIANLNDYRGYEVNNDVGFECGMGFQLGKKLYGYMDDTKPMIDKIPHLGEEREYRDQNGSNVENFDYPANLMFACSMKIIQGDFDTIIKAVAQELS